MRQRARQLVLKTNKAQVFHTPDGTYLSAAVVALVTLETFLILVGLLVLDESISLMKHGVAVTTLLSLLDKRVLLP